MFFPFTAADRSGILPLVTGTEGRERKKRLDRRGGASGLMSAPQRNERPQGGFIPRLSAGPSSSLPAISERRSYRATVDVNPAGSPRSLGKPPTKKIASFCFPVFSCPN